MATMVVSRKQTRTDLKQILSRIRKPSEGSIVILCMAIFNIICMASYLPAGFRTIEAYPLNLGLCVLPNASVALILFLDNHRHVRSIGFAFLIPSLFFILAGLWLM